VSETCLYNVGTPYGTGKEVHRARRGRYVEWHATRYEKCGEPVYWQSLCGTHWRAAVERARRYSAFELRASRWMSPEDSEEADDYLGGTLHEARGKAGVVVG
jgi:hypothetical protein